GRRVKGEQHTIAYRAAHGLADMLSYRGNPPVTARHGRADCLDWVSDERTAPLLRAGVSASGAGRGCPVARHSHRPPTDRELAATHPRPTPRPTTACLAHVNL